MLRASIQLSFKRLAHDSSSLRREPDIKIANRRLGNALRRRADSEAQPRNRSDNPVRKFEPFPLNVTEENKNELMLRAIEPLHDIPYQEQLSAKEAQCRNSLRYLAQQLYKSGTPIRLDVRRLPCPVDPIIGSTMTKNYRNKDDFSIWPGVDRKTDTVGHLIFPISKHGDSVCVEPSASICTKDEVKHLVKIFQDFLSNHAKLGVCHNLGQEGGWRRLSVRSNLDNDLMVVGFLNPRTLTVSQVLEDRNRFKDFMVEECKKADLKLKSLYYQPCPNNTCLHKDVPYELLHGEPRISEKVGKLTINVSPESFLYQNSSSSALLYDKIRDIYQNSFANQDEKHSIIDIRCGTGVLGLQLAEYAAKVIGIDMRNLAIEDARENAKINDISNAEFISSNTEIVLEKVLEMERKSNRQVVAVSDVLKGGLHSNVISVLRDSKQVNKMIYIASKLDAPKIFEDLMSLCEKKIGRSIPPFAPVLASPVDIGPNVESCVTILALERLPE